MEEDRALTDLGIAADIEEAQRQAEQSEAPPTLPSEVEATLGQEPVVKQPKKRFVGRRAADAASQNAGTDAKPSSTTVGRKFILSIYSTSSLLQVTIDDDKSQRQRLTLSHSRKTQKGTTPSKPSPQGNHRRPQPQGGHVPPALKLQLRDPQDHPPHPVLGVEKGRPADARGPAPLRHDNLRHPDAVLPRHRDPHHGGRDVWRLLY